MACIGLAVLFDGFAPAHSASSNAHVDRVCTLISDSARRYGLPETYLARLIWKESRFDSKAVSPAGAEGIAQFMPETASRRGLDDPFDPEQAIPAAAGYLADLRATYGNLGLAAIGYNAGENRLANWLANGGFLPLETEDYVLSITGEPVEHFIKGSNTSEDRPVDEKLIHGAVCRSLPRIAGGTVPMSSRPPFRWAIQVAGSFRRSAAIAQWQLLRRQFPSLLRGRQSFVQRQRSPLGHAAIYAVRLGAKTRAEANSLCERLTKAGGACLVMRS